MKLFNKYLLKVYAQTFYPIFFTLYIITSIVYLVKLATLTSIIQVNFYELLELYSFTIPTILFYTLPITIFISLVLTISKLSGEYELIVITSFGLNPLKIVLHLMPTIIFTTIFLLVNNLALMPKADYMRKVFLENKKKEAQFNIKASQYGQQFASWLIYVNKEKDGVYKDIVLYQPKKNIDQIVIAKKASTNNDGSNLSLNLTDGKALKIDQKISQVNFAKMVINNEIKYTMDINTFDDLILYWKQQKKQDPKMVYFTFSVLSGVLPLVFILFIISFGFYNPRYETNRSVFYSISVTILYIVLSKKLSKILGFDALYILPIIFFIFSYIYYTMRVKKYY